MSMRDFGRTEMKRSRRLDRKKGAESQLVLNYYTYCLSVYLCSILLCPLLSYGESLYSRPSSQAF